MDKNQKQGFGDKKREHKECFLLNKTPSRLAKNRTSRTSETQMHYHRGWVGGARSYHREEGFEEKKVLRKELDSCPRSQTTRLEFQVYRCRDAAHLVRRGVRTGLRPIVSLVPMSTHSAI